MEEPIAWMYELATHIHIETGEYTRFSDPKLSFEKPCVPEGAVRNLRPLYAGEIEV